MQPCSYVMARMTTISVREDVKEKLDRMRKGKSWSTFLLELARKAEEHDKKTAIQELRSLLSEEELEEIAAEAKRFRAEFRLR